MKSAELSIVTINYNNLVGLKRTVNSVLSQKLSSFDYIIVDGASTDGSVDYLSTLNDRNTKIICEPDNGIYEAMNKGISAACGVYLLFLNSGDILVSDEVLDDLINEIDGRTDIYYGNIKVEIGGKELTRTYPDDLTFHYFYYKGHLPHCAMFMRRDLFYRFGMYNEDYRIVSDWEFYVKALCKYNVKYKHIDKVITNFDSGGMSSRVETRKLLLEEKDKCLRENFPMFYEDHKRLSEYNERFGNPSYQMLDDLERSKIGRKVTNMVLRLLRALLGLRNRVKV